MRKAIGKVLEWFMGYEHTVIVEMDSEFPISAYDGDAGYDMIVGKDITIRPNQVVDVPTNLKIDPKENLWFEIKSRSSTFSKRRLEVQDAVIDKGYRGDLYAIAFNPNDYEVHLKRGERIAQIIPHRLIPVKFERGTLSRSTRGSGGFGSSGR